MREPIAHGGALDRAIALYGGARDNWLDLSTGINPRPYPVGPLEGDVWARLPDEGLYQAFEQAARAYYGIGADVAGLAVAGAQAAIQCLPAMLPDGPVHVVEPCYGEYGYVLAGVARSGIDQARSVIVANPNNPDGKHYTQAEIEVLLAAGKTVIIDEAFCDVMPTHSLMGLAGRPNVLVLKSFGKFFGLAGVRLGYVAGDRTMIDRISRQTGPWAVSGPALALGAQALRDGDWQATTRHWLAQSRAALQAMLVGQGFDLVGGTDLFVTVAHDDAVNIATALAQAHILVRTFDYAPTWIRFGLPADAAGMQRLRDALASLA